MTSLESTKETAVYAIVRAGAKQQKVAVGDVIEIEGWQITVADMDTRRVDRLRFVEQVGDDATDSDDTTKGGEPA